MPFHARRSFYKPICFHSALSFVCSLFHCQQSLLFELPFCSDLWWESSKKRKKEEAVKSILILLKVLVLLPDRCSVLLATSPYFSGCKAISRPGFFRKNNSFLVFSACLVQTRKLLQRRMKVNKVYALCSTSRLNEFQGSNERGLQGVNVNCWAKGHSIPVSCTWILWRLFFYIQFWVQREYRDSKLNWNVYFFVLDYLRYLNEFNPWSGITRPLKTSVRNYMSWG